MEERHIYLHGLLCGPGITYFFYSMDLMKKSQTIVEKVFLNETVKNKAPFHLETVPS
jgi:hypothetical protein